MRPLTATEFDYHLLCRIMYVGLYLTKNWFFLYYFPETQFSCLYDMGGIYGE